MRRKLDFEDNRRIKPSARAFRRGAVASDVSYARASFESSYLRANLASSFCGSPLLWGRADEPRHDAQRFVGRLHLWGCVSRVQVWTFNANGKTWSRTRTWNDCTCKACGY